MSLRDDILSASDITTEDVQAWGKTLRVRGMTGKERDAWELEGAIRDSSGNMKPDISNLRARLCARCIVDENGDRVFSDDDSALLGNKSANEIDKVFSVAKRLSGISREDVDALGKGSGQATGDGSSSGLPAT